METGKKQLRSRLFAGAMLGGVSPGRRWSERGFRDQCWGRGKAYEVERGGTDERKAKSRANRSDQDSVPKIWTRKRRRAIWAQMGKVGRMKG